MDLYTTTHTHACTCTHTCAYTHIHTYTYTYFTHAPYTHIYTYTFTNIHRYIYDHKHTPVRNYLRSHLLFAVEQVQALDSAASGAQPPAQHKHKPANPDSEDEVTILYALLRVYVCVQPMHKPANRKQ